MGKKKCIQQKFNTRRELKNHVFQNKREANSGKQRNLEWNNNEEGITRANLKLYYRSIMTKQHCNGTKTVMWINKIEQRIQKYTHIATGMSLLTKKVKIYNEKKKTAFKKNDAEEIEEPDTEEWGLTISITCTNSIKNAWSPLF